MKTHSLEEVTDALIGQVGTKKRLAFDAELRLDAIGQCIKEIRIQKKLTQDQLGSLVGVKKAQISKIENNFTDARFGTILKVFLALNTTVNFSITEAISN
ncbi:MAG: helix-turn-helix domain-containing protein [Flavobacterium psychrophilum]